jgi:hypothetical protein
VIRKKIRMIQNPLMIRRENKDDSKSTGDIKENKDEKSHSESEAAESKDNDVVEFEKTWNVDFEELKKKNPKDNKYIKYWTRVFEKVDKPKEENLICRWHNRRMN